MIVVDTNVIAHLFLAGARTADAERLLAADPAWAAPLLWRSEFRNLLAGYLRRKEIAPAQMRDIAATAAALLGAHEYAVSDDDVFACVEGSSCTAYDCEFVALALSLGVPLITEDGAVRKAFPNIAKSMAEFLRG